jgi:hypothetical protein
VTSGTVALGCSADGDVLTLELAAPPSVTVAAGAAGAYTPLASTGAATTLGGCASTLATATKVVLKIPVGLASAGGETDSAVARLKKSLGDKLTIVGAAAVAAAAPLEVVAEAAAADVMEETADGGEGETDGGIGGGGDDDGDGSDGWETASDDE